MRRLLVPIAALLVIAGGAWGAFGPFVACMVTGILIWVDLTIGSLRDGPGTK